MKKYLALILLCAATARATLVWDATSVTLKPEPAVTSIVAEFAFVNQGNAPITISQVVATCGCTAVQPDKHTYAPQERGVIKATFTPAGRLGRQEKMITVVTDDSTTPNHRLTLIVELPEPYTLTPRLLTWAVGSMPETKVVRFQKNEALKWPLPRLTVTPDGFQVELSAPSADGNSVEIAIRPADTAAARQGRVTLTLATGAVDEDGQTQLQRLQIVVSVR